MPRNSSGTYSLPQAPFVPNTIISSSDMNSNLSDIGTALTQSLATTGVSSMTGPLKAADGSVVNPSYTFAGDTNTGFYRAGTDQIGVAIGGVLAVTINSDLSVTFVGSITIVGSLEVTQNLIVDSNIAVTGAGTQVIGGAGSIVELANSAVVIGSVSVDFNNLFLEFTEVTPPATAAPTGGARLYFAARSINANSAIPFVKDESGFSYPLNQNNGQCRLTKSGAVLLLSPFGGDQLLINGVPQAIPVSGITLAASNSAGVFVYIYAFVSSGNMALEMSTTAPATQTETGIKQKTGDSTRTLVGAAYTDAAGAWADTDGKLWVLSYFNRVMKASKVTLTASFSATLSITNFVEVDANMHNQFICWSDEAVAIDSKVQLAVATVTIGITQLQNNVDGSGGDVFTMAQPFSGNAPLLPSMIPNHSKTSGLTEAANHYVSPYIKMQNVSASVVVSLGANSNENSAIYIQLRG